MKNIMSLKNSREFGLVYQQKVSVANKYLVMYIRENNMAKNRIGISVSKKVGNSVIRHKITRLIRESYRLHKEELLIGYDIVVVARVSAKDCDYWSIESAFMHLAKLQSILK